MAPKQSPCATWPANCTKDGTNRRVIVLGDFNDDWQVATTQIPYGPPGSLADIRDNLIARIAEAEREGRLGEVEGLRVSLAEAEEKIAQLDARQGCRSSKKFLGVPSFDQIGDRTGGEP
ncbi:hypothetical protein [Streptomyces sp. R35]|uniref:Uncharacterized protein n=1 Tax=Streptomyces sp. R35 TaxID=3238630 RepID=A0AB39SKA8_9ACTN